jgi:hypothetical protein
MAGGRRTDRARVTCPYWCGPRACGHAAASRNAVGRCAPDNRARTIAPWSCLAVPYRSTSGSLTALHPSELTGGRSAVLPRRTAAAIGAAGGGARRTGHPCREVLDGAGARRPAGPVVIDGLDRVSLQTEPADDAAGKSIPPACGLIVSVSLNDSWRHAPGRRARPLAARQLIPRPWTSPSKLFWVWFM